MPSELKNFNEILNEVEIDTKNDNSKSENDFSFLEENNLSPQKKASKLKNILPLSKKNLYLIYSKSSLNDESDDEFEDELDDDTFGNNLKEDEKQTYEEIFYSIENNFKKAAELYNIVMKSDAKIGFIYKLSDKTDFINEYNKLFDQLLMELKKTDIANISTSNEKINKMISKLKVIQFMDVINEIKKIDSGDRLLDFYTTKVKDIVIPDIAKAHYFSIEEEYLKGREIENNGSVYRPGVDHSWGTNLAWILAHTQKGSELQVISDIPKNKLRNTIPREEDFETVLMSSHTKTYNEIEKREYSAFIREICCCLKSGYQLEYNGEKTRLSTSEEWKVVNCITNGLKGNGINPDEKTIEEIHQALTKGYNENKPFTYSLKNGLESNSFNSLKTI